MTTLSQKSAYSQQSNAKIASATTLVQDSSQSLTNHNDLTQHFVTNGASNAQFAQPLFIPTSSGLLLTATLPTVLTSQISNLQPISQSPTMTAIHPVSNSDKSSIAVSIEKRSCINMQIPQPTLAVTLPSDNNIQSNFLSNNFTFGVNTATVPIQQTLNDKNGTAFSRSGLLTSMTLSQQQQTFSAQKLTSTNATNNTLSLPVTFSLSTPPPLCVQSKDMVQSSNHLTLSNSQISFATTTNSTVSQLPSNGDHIGSKVNIFFPFLIVFLFILN